MLRGKVGGASVDKWVQRVPLRGKEDGGDGFVGVELGAAGEWIRPERDGIALVPRRGLGTRVAARYIRKRLL